MITSLYAAIIGFGLIALSVNIIKGRWLHGVGIGDGNNVDMKRRIRAQANMVEYAPIFLILMGLAEHNGLQTWGIHSLSVLFLFGRLMHAYSLLFGEQYNAEKLLAKPTWRIRGMVLTFTTIGVVSAINIIQFFMS